MAKNTQPIAKRCRALGISPAVMGYGKKTTNRNPGGQMRKKKSARQLVSHNHFTVNGKRVNIPSYQVKAGDVIEVIESSRSSVKFSKLLGEEAPVVLLPSWLERDKNALKGTVTKLPVREDIDVPIAEHLIVELYSK